VPVLGLRGVTLRFEGVTALDAVSLDVAPGQIFAVIGPNGAGKTSMLNVISGVYRPDVGTVRFRDTELTRLRPHRIAELGIARTFQNIELFPLMTVVENLLVGRHHLMRNGWLRNGLWTPSTRRSEATHRARVEEVVDFLDLERYRDARVQMLPYGVQKRVELGRAMAMEPQLLLLDEPTAGMNQEEIEDVARYILDIKEELGITQILVEHHMGVVMDLADEIVVLDFGERIAQGSPEEVRGDPEVIRAYLGAAAETVL
jgi:branched-chain amino acid transport system ATP-binding protein